MSKRHGKGQKLQGFVVFSSRDKAQAAIIEGAVRQVNSDPRSPIKLRSWTEMNKASSRIITNILSEIDRADYLIADLSGLNPNVLFELGYAFGRRKMLMVLIQGNSEIDRQADMRNIDILSGWEFTQIKNVQQLATEITRYAGRKKAKPEIDTYTLRDFGETGDGLFLKGVTDHDVAVAALMEFKKLHPSTRVDDWAEDRKQTLGWYLEALSQASDVLACLVNSTWDDSTEVNARFSFVSGMAFAFGRRVLMLGLPGYEVAFDYKDWFKQADTSQAAAHFIKTAFSEGETCIDSGRRLAKGIRTRSANVEVADRELLLLDMTIGDTVAENEERDLGEYFIRTAQYEEARTAKQLVLVGPKGTGKSANFLQLRDEFQGDIRNVVCALKPTDYRITRFISALKKLSDPLRGAPYVAESAWKLVVYCQIITAVVERIRRRPISAGYARFEEELLRFVETHKAILEAPFEKKLEIAADWLEQENYEQDNFAKRVHDEFISPAIPLLRPALATRNKVVILVDNLDKAWAEGEDLELQANMAFSLLGVGRRIEADFGQDVDTRLVVFLRSNIYEYYLKCAREQDKLISHTRELTWNDPRQLSNVIEARIDVACKRNGVEPAVAWNSLFHPVVDGVPVDEWIFRRVLPRPRDLIHFIKRAMETAINRGHSVVEPDDLREGLKSYSAFAVSQVVAEHQAEYPWVKTVVSSFFGLPEVMSLREVEGHISRVIEPGADPRQCVVKLVGMGFLGISMESEVRYASTVADSLTLQDKVGTHPPGLPLELVVHPVYRTHLGSTAEKPRRNPGMLELLIEFFQRALRKAG